MAGARIELWMGTATLPAPNSQIGRWAVLAGLPFLSLIARPSGYGLPVPLVWDEESQRFSGYNAMDRKWVRITWDEMARMLEDPNVGVMVSGWEMSRLLARGGHTLVGVETR